MQRSNRCSLSLFILHINFRVLFDIERLNLDVEKLQRYEILEEGGNFRIAKDGGITRCKISKAIEFQ